MISKNLGNNNKKFPYFKKGQFSTASLTGWIIFFSLNSKTEKKSIVRKIFENHSAI